MYKCTPFKELFNREFGAGIGIVEMINRSNIMAIVGGGKTPRFPKNKVMVWDDCKTCHYLSRHEMHCRN